MAEPGNPLLAFSDHAAELVERTAGSIVVVHGGGQWPSSGIHWRSGVIVTAEEVLERDENIKLTLPGGRIADASLAAATPPLMWLCFASSRTDFGSRQPPRHRCALARSCWRWGIMTARRSPRSESSLSQAGLGTAFGVVPSTASFAWTWHSVPRLRAVLLSTCKAVSLG